MDKQLQTTNHEEIPNFVIFKIDNAKVNIDVLFQDETLWLTQKQLAELFEKVVCLNFRHTIQYCISKSVISKMETTCKNYSQARKQCAKFAHTTLDLRKANG